MENTEKTIRTLRAELLEAKRELAKGEARKRILVQVNEVLDETLFEARMTSEISMTAQRFFELGPMTDAILPMILKFCSVKWVALSINDHRGKVQHYRSGPMTDDEALSAEAHGRAVLFAQRWGDPGVAAIPLGAQGSLRGVLLVPRPIPINERKIWDLLAVHLFLPIERCVYFEQLQASDRGKDEFLRMVSHELRTPLNIIHGFGYLHMNDPEHPLPTRHREWMEEIMASAEHMRILVNDLLDYSAIYAGRFSVFPGAVDLAAVLGRMQSAMTPLAAARRQTLAIADLAGVPPVWADERRLEQVLMNLIANAIKHTPEGTLITVRARALTTMVMIQVADDGPGMSFEDQSRLFQPFSTLQPSAEGGIGLGLVICRGMVEAMGGQIDLDSEIGRGSTFEVTIPMAFPEAGAACGLPGEDPPLALA